MRILFAHTDKDLCDRLASLKDKEVNIEICNDGIELVNMFESSNYDVVIIEDVIPKLDAYSCLKKIRETKKNCFVSILSKNFDMLRLKYAYELGANDYIYNQILDDAIILKYKNLKYLTQNYIDNIGPIKIDYDKRMVYVDNEEKILTLKEFSLLVYLIKNQGKVLSREQIFCEVWDYNELSTDDRTIDTHIKKIRNALGKYKNYIETFRGYGYKFEVKNV